MTSRLLATPRVPAARLIPMLLTCLVLTACSSTPKAPPKPATVQTLKVTNRVGGTHYCTLVSGPVWYQTFAGSLLAIDLRTADVVSTTKLADSAGDGPLGRPIDMVIADGKLFVVLEDAQLLVMSLTDPRRPEIETRYFAADLGILPRRLSVLDDQVFVSGDGGVVRLSDMTHFLAGAGEVGRVAQTSAGPAACVGRRVQTLLENKYIGSATDLQPLPEEFNMPGTLLFVRRGAAGSPGALIGLMNADVRKLDSSNATIAAAEPLYSVRAFGGRIWIAAGKSIISYAVKHNRLVEPLTIDIIGARDVAPLEPNYLAVAGSFGRAVYRLSRDSGGAGNSFLRVQREPSRLTRAQSDSRRILAGGDEGAWLYQIGNRAELIDRRVLQLPSPLREAATVAGRARIADDNQSLIITTEAGEQSIAPPSAARIHCVISIEGRFWIAHDRGISVLAQDQAGIFGIEQTAALEEPVQYLFPLLTGRGAAFVSEFCGFGTAEIIDEVAASPSPPS